MLKCLFVLGCLLSLAVANPLEENHKRVARSDSSESNETGGGNPLNNQLLNLLMAEIIRALFTTTTATTTTPTTTTPTTTTTTTTTAATTV
ncbi:anaphase-promoting complex subunit cdh1-like [Cynoglossus semilaevis]|uniref:anaphase-promoting complex subunit cdh1-like n=1 Tax=Cynoglossus semilaevis TaxID=244447 RepID=UPI000495C83C|nr:anaphase-promoting complex subunit cdh1-like [Cynoglossus semilaevis]